MVRLACVGLLAVALPAQEREDPVFSLRESLQEGDLYAVTIGDHGTPVRAFLELGAFMTNKQFRLAESPHKPAVDRTQIFFASPSLRVRTTDFVRFWRTMVFVNGFGSSVDEDGNVDIAPLRRGAWLGFERAGRYAALEDLGKEAERAEGPLLIALPTTGVTAAEAVVFLWPWTHGAASDRSLDGLRAGAAGEALLVLQGAPGQLVAARTMVELFEDRSVRRAEAGPVEVDVVQVDPVTSKEDAEVVLSTEEEDYTDFDSFVKLATLLTEKELVFTQAAAAQPRGVIALPGEVRIGRAWVLPYVRAVLYAAGYQTAASEDGGRFELVPLVDRPSQLLPAFDTAKPFVAPPRLTTARDDEVLTAVPLRRIIAPDARRLLRPVLEGPLGRQWGRSPKLGIAGADLLVLQGPPAHLAVLARAVELLDVAPDAEARPRLGVAYLRHTTAADTARRLDEVLGREPATGPPARLPPGVVPIGVVPIAGRGALVLVGTFEQMAAARAEITRLDFAPENPRGR